MRSVSLRIGVGLLFMFAGSFTTARAGEDTKDETIKKLRAELEAAQKKSIELQRRNETLELELLRLQSKLTTAELDEHIQRLRRETEQLEKELDRTRERNNLRLAQRLGMSPEEWRDMPPDLRRTFPIPPAPRYPRAPAPRPSLEGVVSEVSGELVCLDIGIDAGLRAGRKLGVYRIEWNETRNLGTVKITSAFNLFPKGAIATFTPDGNVPLAKLKPEDLPRKGDVVRHLPDSTDTE